MFGSITRANVVNYDVKFTFRWTLDLRWQRGGTALDDSDIGTQPFLVYARTVSLDDARSYVLASCGGQEKVKCLRHDKYLITSKFDTLSCVIVGCRRKTRWRCAEGIPDEQCDVAVCAGHLKEFYDRADIRHQYVGRYGPEPRNGIWQVEDMDHNPDIEDEDREPEIIPQLPDDDHEALGGANEAAQPLAIGEALPIDLLQDDILPSSTAFTDNFVSADEQDERFLNHHLLNHTNLHVLSRETRTSKAPLTAQRLLQNICCKAADETVPLITPEAQLFTLPFWARSGQSVAGAMPSIMYTRYAMHKRNIANILDHIRVRVRDPTLITSKCAPVLQYLFDVNLNVDLNYNPTMIVTQKGLEHLVRRKNVVEIGGKESVLPMMDSDSNLQVRRLVALQREEGMWNLFLTLTCNDNATLGVWPITKAIEAKYDENDTRKNALQSYSVIMCRSWERASRIMWHYILHSPEQPLGRVKTGWMRYEFQSGSALGNKPHVHAGLTLHPENRNAALYKIHCTVKDMFSSAEGTDEENLIRCGIVASHEEFVRLYDLAVLLQNHQCKSASSRCLKKSVDDTEVCRLQRHLPSFRHTFKPKTHVYDERTLRNLEALDLAHYDINNNEWDVCEQLQPGVYSYAAEPHEHFVPTNGRIFALMQSSTNLQFCDNRFNIAYLAKYAAGIEERPRVDITLDDDKTARVHVQQLRHEKISGQRIVHNTEKKNYYARIIPLTDMIWYTCNLPYVVSDRDFVHVSTLPPEYRSSVLKRHRPHRVEGGGPEPESVVARQGLPLWRQFTDSQKLLISAQMDGSYYVDTTTAFSIRCPELHTVESLEVYSRFFVKSPTPSAYLVAENLADTPWMDGLGFTVRLRPPHLQDVVMYFEERALVDENAALILNEIIRRVVEDHLRGQPTELLKRFVDCGKVHRAVVVFTQITPTNASRFYTHLLLTMGSFSDRCITELDLYSEGNLLDAFRAVNLVGANPCMEDVHRIARRYVVEQLGFMMI